MIKELANYIGFKNLSKEDIDKMCLHYDLSIEKENNGQNIVKKMLKLTQNVFDSVTLELDREHVVEK